MIKKLGLLGLLLSASINVQADESLFGFLYGADVLPKGAVELSAASTSRWDKDRGHYYANDFNVELEYGVTDKLEIAAYLLGQSVNHRNAFPTEDASGDPLYPDRNQTKFSGVQLQLKYNILSPYKDAFGFTVYLEPQYIRYFKVDGSKTQQYELEAGFIFQKNFLDDQLVIASNHLFSIESRKLIEDGGEIEHEAEMTNLIGVTYRFAPGWYAGFETRHHMDVLQQEDNTFKKNQYSWYAGPTLHYASQKWWATVGYMRQIKGNPTYSRGVYPVTGGVKSSLHLDENEKNELRVRVGYEF